MLALQPKYDRTRRTPPLPLLHFPGSMTPRLPTQVIMTTTVTQVMMLHFLNGSSSLTRRLYQSWENGLRTAVYAILSSTSLPSHPWSEIFLYHPLIISHDYGAFTRYSSLKWPKNWMGEPTTVILRASRGMLAPTPVQQFPIAGRGRGPASGKSQTGIPDIFRLLVTELISLWARPPPQKKNWLLLANVTL